MPHDRDATERVIVERRWIASSNAEWGCLAKGQWHRGGSLSSALACAGAHIDPMIGGAVEIRPDETGAQARAASEAFFGPQNGGPFND